MELIKFSTNTLMSVPNVMDADGWVECCCIFSSIIFSNGFRGRGFTISIGFMMTSQALFVIDQKKGGLSHHR